MRKLLVLILAVALILPASVLADERDPIVGSWYLYADITLYPEMAFAYPGKDYLVDLYNFMPDGTVMALGLEQAGKEGTTSFKLSGRWEKSDDHYIFMIMGTGETTVYVKDDLMYFNTLVVGGADAYMILHRAIPMNPYKDFVKTVD